VRLRDSMSA